MRSYSSRRLDNDNNNYQYVIFFRYQSVKYFYLSSTKSGTLYFGISPSGFTNKLSNPSSTQLDLGNEYSGNWQLVVLSVSGTTGYVFINNANVISFSIASYSETGSYSTTIGYGSNYFGSGSSDYSGYKSFRGYVWNFIISSDLISTSSFCTFSNVNNCVQPFCPFINNTSTTFNTTSNCTISNESDYKKNSDEDSCDKYKCHDGYGCSGNICLSCICDYKSCVINSTYGAVCYCNSPSYPSTDKTDCNCSDSSVYNGTACGLASTCSNDECKVCSADSSVKCVSCKAHNAFPDDISGCSCNPGYINTSLPLSNSLACVPCSNSQCKTCDINNNCLSCVADNANVTNSLCACNAGY